MNNEAVSLNIQADPMTIGWDTDNNNIIVVLVALRL